MGYYNLFEKTLRDLGFDLTGVWNTYTPPYCYSNGWPLKLPDIEFKPNTLLLLHFQDFVTPVDGRVLELELVEQHYGEHAHQVVVTHWPHDLASVYQGPVNLIEFSGQHYNLTQRLRRRWQEWKHVVDTPRTMAWQCLNGRTCPHRKRAVDVLQHWPNGVLSYGNEIALPEWAYSTYRGTENDENFIRLAGVYGKCAVNIVTETQYDCYPGIITEKTIMAFAAQQVPVVIGHAGIVQHCKNLGFDMFEDLVDTSYDTLPNSTRLEQALALNQDLIQGKIDLAPYQQRLQRNREYLLGGFLTWMENRFKRDCQQLAQDKLAIHFSTFP